MKKFLTTYIICFFCIFIACQTERPEATRAETDVLVASPELTQLNELLKSQPDESDLWFQRGSLYYNIQKYPEAIRDLKTVLEIDSSDGEARHLLADALLDNIQSREALEMMESTAKMFPERIATLLKLSEFQLILRRYAEAIATLNQIQQIEPQNADAFFMKGMVMKENGDTTESIAQFQAATKEDPQLIDAWINLGQLHEAKNDPNAIRYFDGGLAVSPDNALLLHAKAQYLGRNNRIAEAKDVYRLMMQKTPYASEPYYDLGLLYLDEDSLAQATTHFDLSIKLDPMVARVYFYRGLTKEMMGDKEAARHDYEQTLQLDPDDKDAIEALERLNKNI